MICKICSNTSTFLFDKKILGKYNVKYYQCSSCLFVQTEEPFWLEEAYKNAITSLDIGMISRNNYLTPIVYAVANSSFDTRKKYLDFGGGYGILVRLLRDKGLDFYRQDKFCENLFSKNFDVEDLKDKTGFEFVTAFELFEHLPSPYQGIEEMLQYSKTILFSTDLIPDNIDIASWEYLVPEVGQHVALYHYKSLEAMSRKLNLHLYSNKRNIHMLSEKKINPFLFRLLTRFKISWLYNNLFFKHSSLLEKDYQFLKKQIAS